MRRTVPILSGLAILGVVFNHANWHVLSQFSAGATGGYPFVIFDQVGKFAIVAFMFISGYFIAYATSGGKNDLRWEIIRARLWNLLWPWLVWSALMTVGQYFQGRPISVAEYLRNLIIQYYFVPLLILYYLLAPVIARWAKINTRALLIGAAVVQLGSIALFYARVYLADFPGPLKSWIDVGPLQYLRFAFYFPFGVVAGMFPQKVKGVLVRFKSTLPWLTLFFFCLSVAETCIPYSLGGQVWTIGGDQTKLSSALFSTALILCFVVFDKIPVPLDRLIIKLGTRTYGLYLSHYVILGVSARIISRVAPWADSQGWLLMPVLFLLTVALAMLLMDIVARLPTKRLYPYLFG